MGVSKNFNVPMMLYSGSVPYKSKREFPVDLREKTGDASKILVNKLSNGKEIQFERGRYNAAYKKANPTQTEGNVFEAAIASASGAKFDDKRV